jgi:hypothetical protein
VGLKLRTGGLEAAAIPACDDVAAIVAACAADRVPFKATAGLHQPIRHLDAAMGAKMHGFVNVFAAGCLAMVHGLDEESVGAIVADEDPSHFQIDEQGLLWHAPEGARLQELSATIQELTDARSVFTSFGSCSFDEPVEGLHSLGWSPVKRHGQ